MKLHTTWLALCCVLLAAPVLAAPPFGPGGANVHHLTLRTDFEPSTEGGPAGSLSAKLRKQGMADVQKIQVELGGLVDGVSYSLVAVLSDGSEVALDAFEADENGEAAVKLMHIGHKNASGKKFPMGLESLADVETVELRDGVTVVLAADLTHPDSLKYLLKRGLTNSGVDDDAAGQLLMKESAKEGDTKASFRLRAWDLDATAYTLAINCSDAATLMCEYTLDVTADAGRLDVMGLTDPAAPLPFDMTDVSLVTGGQVVLSTELP